MAQLPNYSSAEYHSRREIDLAVGALMGIRRASAEEAWAAIIDAVRACGFGPGRVSRALLTVVSGDENPAVDSATAHWNAVLDLRTPRAG